MPSPEPPSRSTWKHRVPEVIKTPKPARRVVPSLATGWSHPRGRKPFRVVPCSWQATNCTATWVGSSGSAEAWQLPDYCRREVQRPACLAGGQGPVPGAAAGKPRYLRTGHTSARAHATRCATPGQSPKTATRWPVTTALPMPLSAHSYRAARYRSAQSASSSSTDPNVSGTGTPSAPFAFRRQRGRRLTPGSSRCWPSLEAERRADALHKHHRPL